MAVRGGMFVRVRVRVVGAIGIGAVGHHSRVDGIPMIIHGAGYGDSLTLGHSQHLGERNLAKRSRHDRRSWIQGLDNVL